MKPRIRPRKPASIGSNQASPANSPSATADVVLSLFMAWSPPARQRRALVVESQPETTSSLFQPHPGRHYQRLGGSLMGKVESCLLLHLPRWLENHCVPVDTMRGRLDVAGAFAVAGDGFSRLP